MADFLPENYVLSRESAEKLRRILDAQPGARWGTPPNPAGHQVAIVTCGSSVSSSPHIYEGTINLLRGPDATWEEATGPCYLTEVDDDTLTNGDSYTAIRSGDYTHSSDTRPLFGCVLTGAGASLTVEDSSAGQAVSGVDVLQFGTAALWTIANPAAGVARVTPAGYSGSVTVLSGTPSCSGDTWTFPTKTFTIVDGIITGVA